MSEKSHDEMTLAERLDWSELPPEEKRRRAVAPLRLWCDKGHYKKTCHWTTFNVREYDSLGRDLDSYNILNQRHTAVRDGKISYYYVWSCSCRLPDCRHIGIAKRIYFTEWKKKKNAEAWLLKNDPTYITAKMAAEGWVSG
jgi:hypothetical protein